MTDNTKIEWADTTWNPVLGCDRVSPGCDNCYAIGQARIRSGSPNTKIAEAFAGLVDRTDDRLDWTGRINLMTDRLGQPLRWRKPRRIFVNSLSDLFHDGVPDEFIAEVFSVMARAPQHTFQLLTKRHGRMRSLLNRPSFRDNLAHLAPWPLPNLWVGVSVEDQKRADLRIPALLDTPAAVRWISAEPLLGPLYGMDGYLRNDVYRCTCGAWEKEGIKFPRCADCGRVWKHQPGATRLDWIVTGGESGPGARPAHPDWFRSLRDQCQAAGVAYLHKQNGAWVPEAALLHRDTAPAAFLDIDGAFRPLVGGKPTAPPMARGEAITVRRVGKKAAGRELDGRTWDEYPEVAAS